MLRCRNKMNNPISKASYFFKAVRENTKRERERHKMQALEKAIRKGTECVIEIEVKDDERFGN